MADRLKKTADQLRKTVARKEKKTTKKKSKEHSKSGEELGSEEAKSDKKKKRGLARLVRKYKDKVDNVTSFVKEEVADADLADLLIGALDTTVDAMNDIQETVGVALEDIVGSIDEDEKGEEEEAEGQPDDGANDGGDQSTYDQDEVNNYEAMKAASRAEDDLLKEYISSKEKGQLLGAKDNSDGGFDEYERYGDED